MIASGLLACVAGPQRPASHAAHTAASGEAVVPDPAPPTTDAPAPPEPTPPTFLLVVEGIALRPDCRDVVQRQGALHLAGVEAMSLHVHPDDRLLSFSAFEACVQELAPVAVRLSRADGSGTRSCTGFRVEPCEQEARPELAVYGTFQQADLWAVEPMWHMERADFDGKEDFTRIPRELVHDYAVEGGFVLHQREQGPDELRLSGKVLREVPGALFPRVDGTSFLYQDGKLHALRSADLPVAFESYAVTRLPEPARDEPGDREN